MMPSLFNLLVTLAYYILRPHSDEDIVKGNTDNDMDLTTFKEWWHRGKWICVLMILSVVASAYGTFFLMGNVTIKYMTSTADFCTYGYEGTGKQPTDIAVTVFWPAIVFSLVLMF